VFALALRLEDDADHGSRHDVVRITLELTLVFGARFLQPLLAHIQLSQQPIGNDETPIDGNRMAECLLCPIVLPSLDIGATCEQQQVEAIWFLRECRVHTRDRLSESFVDGVYRY